MSKLLNILTAEPVMTAISALVAATIGALIAFHVHITPIQREALEGWGIAVLALGVAVRSQVTPKLRGGATKVADRVNIVLTDDAVQATVEQLLQEFNKKPSRQAPRAGGAR